MSHRGTAIRCATLLIVIGAVSCGGDGAPREEPAAHVEDLPQVGVRNPFGFEDVVDCCGQDALAFAEENAPPGGPGDENAALWTDVGAGGEHVSIDGEWASRWRLWDGESGSGTATIRTLGERVFIYYRDEAEYLAEAERHGDRLVGRYVSQLHSNDRSFWVGTIVSNGRIDGVYQAGRWDFRRADGASGGE